MLEEVLRQILQSLLLSCLYSLTALGLTLSYSVTKIANFAHAEYVTVGAYMVVIGTIFFNLNVTLSLILAIVIAALVALGTDELVFKPLYKRGASSLQLLVASIGVGLFIRYLLSIYADVYDLLNVKAMFSVNPIFYIGYGAFTNVHLIALSTTGILLGLLYLLRAKTRIGKAMRALSSNMELAQVSGIPIWRVRRLSWLLAGALAGVGGGIWALYTNINPESGWRLLLWIFSASIIGNLVSFPGTVLGGFVIGFSENLGMWFANRSLGIDPAYKPIVAYLAIAITLLIRQSGLSIRGLALPSGLFRRFRGEHA